MSVEPMNQRLEGAEVVQVIRVRYVVGDGTEADPCCWAERYFDVNGKLLADTVHRVETEGRHGAVQIAELEHQHQEDQARLADSYAREQALAKAALAALTATACERDELRNKLMNPGRAT